ncbi:Uncharacterized protein ACMD2_08138 [Ananas comosus]|uniref:Uncharacterized protein n=1 Tax=Ananas comosus TaxID=4615 RepID=A0A199V2N7_ANACO|nr:Uncharacterized protein ACMD2_08138 [Ananas comosus]
MGISRNRAASSSSSASPCAQLRSAYHDCFNRWYSEKFSKGRCEEDECVAEWDKYKACLVFLSFITALFASSVLINMLIGFVFDSDLNHLVLVDLANPNPFLP